MATRCQPLANALDNIKCHLSATDEDIWTIYGFDYVLFNGGMIFVLQGQCQCQGQGQGHSIWITESAKMTYFGEITGPRSLSIQHYSDWQILVDIFQKLISSTSWTRR